MWTNDPTSVAIESKPMLDARQLVPEKDFLTVEQVERVTSLSCSTIYRLMAVDQFPKSFSIGGGKARWLRSEVTEYLLQCVLRRYRTSAATKKSPCNGNAGAN